MKTLRTIAALLLLASPAAAYIPTGPQILERLAASAFVPPFHVEVELILVRPWLLDGEGTLPARLTFRPPDRYRWELDLPMGRETIVANGNRKVTLHNGEIVQTAGLIDPTQTDLFWWSGSSAAELERGLTAWGVDIEQARLGRSQGRPCYILGGRTPADSQLWIEVQTMLPVQVRIVTPLAAPAPPQVREIVYEDFARRSNDDVTFPTRITLLRNGRIVESWRARSIVFGSDPDELPVEQQELFNRDRFDVDYLLREAPRSDAPAGEPWSIEITGPRPGADEPAGDEPGARQPSPLEDLRRRFGTLDEEPEERDGNE